MRYGICSRSRGCRVLRAATYVGRSLEERKWSVPRIAQVLTRVRCFQRASSTSWIVMLSTRAHIDRAAPDRTWAWTPHRSETTLAMSALGALLSRWFLERRQELTWRWESLIPNERRLLLVSVLLGEHVLLSPSGP